MLFSVIFQSGFRLDSRKETEAGEGSNRLVGLSINNKNSPECRLERGNICPHVSSGVRSSDGGGGGEGPPAQIMLWRKAKAVSLS